MTIKDHVENLPCCICGESPCHALTIKKNILNAFLNYLPLCSDHFFIVDLKGLKKAIDLFPVLGIALKERGWTFEQGRLNHRDLELINGDHSLSETNDKG